MEVSAAAPADTRLEVRPEALADRRDRLEDRPAVLPLLPANKRNELPERSVQLLLGDPGARLLLEGGQGGLAGPNGEKTTMYVLYASLEIFRRALSSCGSKKFEKRF